MAGILSMLFGEKCDHQKEMFFCEYCKEYISDDYLIYFWHHKYCERKITNGNKMKDKQFSEGDMLEADILGLGVMLTVKFIRYVDEEFVEAIDNNGLEYYIHIDKLKKIEENKMKHPCGKVFDPKLPVRLRVGRKARIVCTDKKCSDGITIVALYDSYEIFDDKKESCNIWHNCGHFFNSHEDNDNDLVNVPEKEEKKEVDSEKIKFYIYEICCCLHALNNHYDSKSLFNKYLERAFANVRELDEELEKLS